jgi:hypothetical protein
MRHKSFVSKSTAEEKQPDIHIAEDAALSRLRPIPDGSDQLEAYRRCMDTDLGGLGHLDLDNAPI